LTTLIPITLKTLLQKNPKVNALIKNIFLDDKNQFMINMAPAAAAPDNGLIKMSTIAFGGLLKNLFFCFSLWQKK